MEKQNLPVVAWIVLTLLFLRPAAVVSALGGKAGFRTTSKP